MQIQDEIVDRSAEEGARLVALALLQGSDGAAERLAKGDGDEALHDFRVGLRRLRSTLRAFRPWLAGSLRKKTEKRLKKLAHATNVARDAQVQLAWLSAQRERLSGRLQPGLDMLCDRYRERRDGSRQEQERVLARYGRASAELAQRLQTYEGHVGAAADGVSFGGVLARLLAEHLGELHERLEAIRGASDQEAVHEARIAAKRLRYLLEPLRGNRHADAREAVKRLKRLQDVLGELHDAHVLAAEIGETLVDAAGARARHLFIAAYAPAGELGQDALRAGPRTGLLALVRIVRERRDALYADLQREAVSGAEGALAAVVKPLAAALEARAGGQLTARRKYLLSAAPPRALEAPAIEIAQGWLPGERLREQVRRFRGPEGERYSRALKRGSGFDRIESDEQTTREVFEALWPFTDGRRIAKERHEVQEGALTWKIDRFLDRELILAEVRLALHASDAAPPEWLRPLVVREVTDDPAYLDERLAADHVEAPPVPARGVR
jgi:CHAD domain-containing protein/CYTH domain-containing protein